MNGRKKTDGYKKTRNLVMRICMPILKLTLFLFSKCHKRNEYRLVLQFLNKKNVNKGSVGNIAKDMKAFYINKTIDNIITMNVLSFSLYGPVCLPCTLTIIVLYDAVIYKFPYEHELDILIILQVYYQVKCFSFL